MNKIFLFIFFLIPICCHAQKMTTVFGDMPKEKILYLDSIQRQDLMDLYKSNISDTIRNNLNGTTQLKNMNDNYLEVISGNYSMQMVLLPMINESKIICMVQTVCAPVCDSRINFYTIQWKPINTSDIIRFVDNSWFIKENTDLADENFINASKSLDMDLMQYSIDPENFSLWQTFNTPKYLSKNDKDDITPYLKEEPKVYTWVKTGYK